MPGRSKAAGNHAVFISYASRDRAHADAICAALERDGVRCWIAPRDGTPGDSYAAFLVEAIAASKLVVLVFSRAANRSDAVLNELELAFHRGIPILPVRVQNVEPSRAAEFYLRRRHWFDAFTEPAARLDALSAAVRAALEAPSAAAKRSRAPARQAVVPAGNLPPATNSFHGRDREIAELGAALDAERLVTLWGTGGVGKTRLALEVARRRRGAFAHGAWFVDLAPLHDDEAVTPAVAATLGVREEPKRSLLETLAAAFSARHALVVLDNCEQVLAGCARLVEAVMRAAPGVTFVCTTREPLALGGERVVHIEPFAVPSPSQASAGDAIVQLFLQRAAAAGAPALGEAELCDVATICARLDGIPFAIELAAARTRSMAPKHIVAALDARFRLLTGGSRTALPRQQTLLGTLDWSYGLLTQTERIVLRRLAVFAGGWGLEGLRAVVAFDGIEEWDALDALHVLVDKSLVVARADGERYRLLETTREYAHEQLLAAGEVDAANRQHARYYRAFAERTLHERWATGSETPLAGLRAERNNLLAAHEWALGAGNDALLAAALVGSLAAAWDFDGMQQAGLRRLEASIAALPEGVRGAEAAIVWLAFALLASSVTTTRRELEAAERAVELARDAGAALLEARALSLLAHVAAQLGHTDRAQDASSRALEMFRALGDARGIAASLAAQALHASRAGDFARARGLYGEALAIDRERGDKRMSLIALLSVAEMEFAAGETQRAVAMGREAVVTARELENRTLLLHALVNLGAYLIEAGAREDALAAAGEVIEAARDRNYSVFGCKAVEEVAVLAAESGARDVALRLHRRALVELASMDYVREATEQRVYERFLAVVGENDPHAVRACEAGAYDAMIEDAACIARTAFAAPAGSLVTVSS